ncbi:hypothetical protein BDZ85DRAFT_277596 [Elsinoe ampelina]|uniref:Uncharacterized protein n=1 Tax=Elsinoe ampelina TaxID=302913 RepID=A0A6A6GPP7_9PEZI|nr:hypothetical protein BDZ85DRAFT_277596 [Elsinoe ampelina]
MNSQAMPVEGEPPPPYEAGPSNRPLARVQSTPRGVSTEKREQKLKGVDSGPIQDLYKSLLEQQLDQGFLDTIIVLIFPDQGIKGISMGEEIVGHDWDENGNVVVATIPDHGGSARVWAQSGMYSNLRENIRTIVHRYNGCKDGDGRMPLVAIEEVSLRAENEFGLYTTRTLQVLVIKTHI